MSLLGHGAGLLGTCGPVMLTALAQRLTLCRWGSRPQSPPGSANRGCTPPRRRRELELRLGPDISLGHPPLSPLAGEEASAGMPSFPAQQAGQKSLLQSHLCSASEARPVEPPPSRAPWDRWAPGHVWHSSIPSRLPTWCPHTLPAPQHTHVWRCVPMGTVPTGSVSSIHRRETTPHVSLNPGATLGPRVPNVPPGNTHASHRHVDVCAPRHT